MFQCDPLAMAISGRDYCFEYDQAATSNNVFKDSRIEVLYKVLTPGADDTFVKMNNDR